MPSCGSPRHVVRWTLLLSSSSKQSRRTAKAPCNPAGVTRLRSSFEVWYSGYSRYLDHLRKSSLNSTSYFLGAAITPASLLDQPRVPGDFRTVQPRTGAPARAPWLVALPNLSKAQQIRLVIEARHRSSYLLEGPLCQQATVVEVEDHVCAPDGRQPVRDGDRGYS